MPLRLGEDAFSIGRISKKNKAKLFNTIKAYKLMIDAYEPASFKSCATAALRTAENGKEIVQEIKEKIGLNIEIISGKEEAQIIMSNHIEKHLDQNKHYVYIDVGGGSTEISFISNLKKSHSKSFSIGSKYRALIEKSLLMQSSSRVPQTLSLRIFPSESLTTPEL